MAGCNQIIEHVYNNEDLKKLISKIKPESLQDDLRQEVAMSLLEKPCEKITELFAGDNLIRYTMRVCWRMATSKNSSFFYTYKKSNFTKAVEYMNSLRPLPEIPISLASIAQKSLAERGGDMYGDHEVRIFNKYVELGSSRAVARFYNIPVNHVCNVVNKVKKELKCSLLS